MQVQHTDTEIKKYKLWIKLISADWFSIFLTYLRVKDIVRLDPAFTNHEDRPKWLSLLTIISPSFFIVNKSVDNISDWLIQKDVHPSELLVFCKCSSKYYMALMSGFLLY